MRSDKILISCAAFCCCISGALAVEIPIEDLSDNTIQLNQYAPAQRPAQLVTSQSLTADQRLIKLEQQMNNFTQIDLMGKIDNLQEQIQQLRGELEVQKHDLKLMHDQLNNFYQDLDKRIGKNSSNISTLVTAATESNNKNEAKVATKSNLDGVPFSDSKIISEDQVYQDSLKLIKSKKYNDSILKLQSYLKDYPSGKYSANAHYWMGEIYYMQSKMQKAADEFQTIINIYPNSSKVPDAMLKIGIIYNERGEYNKAYKQFQQLKKQYPDSNAAHLADR